MILITGGAGYIGSNSVIEFLKNGYDVVIVDNLSTGHIQIVERLKNTDFEGKIKDFFEIDLKNKNDLEKVFEKYDFEAVIHFAAASLVGESVKEPQKYYHNNVFGTLNLLDCIIKYKVKNLVFSSTAATYGNPISDLIDENHVQKPINPYGNTKLAIEYMIKDYAHAYNFNYMIFRYFNVIGANKEVITGEWHDIETHLVPNILKADEKKVFSLFGDDYDTKDGTCVRDYIDVVDLARAHRLAFEYIKNGKSDIVNLGTKDGKTVKEIFNICEKVLDKKIPLKICERREGDPAKLVANSARSKEILNWENKTPLEESIKNAYRWEQERKKL